jgi:hypothetical protein
MELQALIGDEREFNFDIRSELISKNVKLFLKNIGW